MTPQKAVLALAEDDEPESEVTEVQEVEEEADQEAEEEEEHTEPWENVIAELSEKIDQGFATLHKHLRKRKPRPASSQPAPEPKLGRVVREPREPLGVLAVARPDGSSQIHGGCAIYPRGPTASRRGNRSHAWGVLEEHPRAR